jgi:hypothetical protein
MVRDDLQDLKHPDIIAVNLVNGVTTINNNIRVKLNLSMEEYAIMEHVEKSHRDSVELTYSSIYSKTGIEHDPAKIVFNNLWERGFLITSNTVSRFKPSPKWLGAFSGLKDEFEQFWHSMDIDMPEGIKRISWTGSKIDAEKKFCKLRRIETFDYLMKQKVYYFKVIASSSYRTIMGCSVFLNVETKRYSEDWASQIDKEKFKEVRRKSKITVKDVKSKF